MEFSELQALMEELRANDPMAFHRPMIPATDDQIAKAEQELGVKFPPEYYRFLKEFGGGTFAYISVFSVKQNGRWDVVAYNREWRCLEKRCLAFSDDGCGGYYAFPVKNGVCQSNVIYFDHDEDYGNGKLIPTEYENLFDYIAELGLKP